MDGYHAVIVKVIGTATGSSNKQKKSIILLCLSLFSRLSRIRRFSVCVVYTKEQPPIETEHMLSRRNDKGIDAGPMTYCSIGIRSHDDVMAAYCSVHLMYSVYRYFSGFLWRCVSVAVDTSCGWIATWRSSKCCELAQNHNRFLEMSRETQQMWYIAILTLIAARLNKTTKQHDLKSKSQTLAFFVARDNEIDVDNNKSEDSWSKCLDVIANSALDVYAKLKNIETLLHIRTRKRLTSPRTLHPSLNCKEELSRVR